MKGCTEKAPYCDFWLTTQFSFQIFLCSLVKQWGEEDAASQPFFCVPFQYWPFKKKSLVRTELLISNQQTVLAWYSVNLLEMNQTSSSEILFSCDWWNSLLFFKSSPFDNVFFDKEPNRHMEFQNKKYNNSNLLEVSL